MFRRQQFNLLLFPLALQVFFVPAFQAVVDADGGASEISGHGWNHETLDAISVATLDPSGFQLQELRNDPCFQPGQHSLLEYSEVSIANITT